MRLPIGEPADIGRRFINLNPELTVAIVRTIQAGWRIAVSRVEVMPEADEAPRSRLPNV